MTGLHAKNFTLGNITNWNVSNVTNMKGMFAYAGYYSDTWSIGTLSLWDTSQVESMNQMFNQAGANKDAIKNLNLEDWDVTKVVDKNDYEHETYNEKTWPQYCWFENGDGVRNRTGIVAPKAFKIKNYDEYCYPVSYEKHQENIN